MALPEADASTTTPAVKPAKPRAKPKPKAKPKTPPTTLDRWFKPAPGAVKEKK